LNEENLRDLEEILNEPKKNHYQENKSPQFNLPLTVVEEIEAILISQYVDHT
jgi:hypothetical protein